MEQDAEPRSPTVLVVDDDEDSLSIFCTTLASRGMRVLGASSGEEAISATRGVHPDLVVLDLVLGGEDGWSVLQRLRMQEGMSRVPFLVVTASSDPENSWRASCHHGLRYMEKPLPPRTLMAAVAEMLRDA